MDIIEFSNVDNVRLMDSFDSSIGIKGKLHITVTHLIFLSDDLKEEKWILIHLISSVDSPTFGSTGKSLSICSKDFHNYRFIIEDSNGCEKLKLVLLKLIANIDQHCKLPCFSTTYLSSPSELDGWIPPSERLKLSFRRMGLPNNKWKFTDINENYKMSDTYPSVIVIPQGTSKSIMDACSKFRSRGRLPSLTYYYSPKRSAMCRCSQPLVGFSARCNEDITMLKRIKDAASEEHTDRLHVVDTRPKINAITNRAKGKGYESEIDYEKIVFQFFQIENIHVMRSSLEKLLKVCRNTKHSSLSSVEKSGWLRHIKWILDASFYISQKLQLGENVVVHCSDGWDRTSQVCSVTQIIIDPFYRTIEGLEDVIEKDWLSFGHKFNDRCGHLSNIDPAEISPVFTQFLDCVYQLYNCYPNQFEYNERLLRHLHRWSQDCMFGTFVGNCEKDRLDLKSHERCLSVWGHVRSNLWDYLNPYYEPAQIIPVIEEPLKVSDLSFWHALYCPIEDMSNINSYSINISDNLFTMVQQTRSVKYQSDHLWKRATQLMTMLHDQKELLNDNGRLSSAINRFTELKQQMFAPEGDQNNNNTLTDDAILYDSNLSQILSQEIASVALDLPIVRHEKSCTHCSHNLDKLSRMNLCYMCGQYYCPSCIAETTCLPGHGDVREKFPVCHMCSVKIKEYRVTVSNMGCAVEENQQLQTQDLSGRGSSCISNDPLMDIVLQKDLAIK